MSAATSLPAYTDGFLSVFKPTPPITVDEWAEKFRILPQSGAAAPGPWRNSRTPYLIEIMRELSPTSRAKQIIFAKGSQIGATEAGLNWLMFLIDYQPGPIIAFQPTQDNAARWSKQRVTPSLEQCRQTRDKIVPMKSRQSGNTILQKDFAGGGTLFLSGANTPNALASTPAGNLYFDEVDRYPGDVGKEGDPIDLALRRIATFSRAKAFFSSTPVLKATSRIWRFYEDSDRRIYEVPCPHCGEYHQLLFENLKWPKGEPHKAQMICPHCGVFIQEYNKTKMLAAGRWTATNPGHWRVGFHLSSLYSPVGWYSWVDAARDFEDSEGDVNKRKAFYNTVLGLPWEEDNESLAAEYLSRRVEPYTAQVPEPVLLMTLAVDVQKDRLECEVCGWGVGEESWGIEYHVIRGDPSVLWSDNPSDPSVWQMLDDYRMKGFRRADGMELRVAVTFIDSGGSYTDIVYQYTRPRERFRVFSVRGGSQSSRPLLSKPTRGTRNKAALFVLGVDKGKELVYARLRIDKAGPGYCHFPADESTGYDPVYYAGLTSERRIIKQVGGRTVLRWEKVTSSARNEPLDLRVYGTAAIRMLAPNWEMMEARRGNEKKTSPIRRSTGGNTSASLAGSSVGAAVRRPQGVKLATY